MTAIYQLARVLLSGNPTPCALPKVTNAKLDAMAAADVVGWCGLLPVDDEMSMPLVVIMRHMVVYYYKLYMTNEG